VVPRVSGGREKRVRYLFDSPNKESLLVLLIASKGPYFPHCHQVQSIPIAGRLGQRRKKEEFSIGNYVSSFAPFMTLSCRCYVPQEGTFHQTRPLDLLVGNQVCYSYSFDFQSATDGWSLVFLFETRLCLFDRSFASSAVHSSLETNIF
jgi:hypothetical protein